MSRTNHQKTLDDNLIKADLLREFLWKGLTAPSIQAIDDHMKLLAKQQRVLRKMKKELQNERKSI